MRVSEIKKLFPATVEVTKEMIDTAFIMNPAKCVGANALKSILASENQEQVYWGAYSGGIWKKGVQANKTYDADALLLIESVDENGKAINMMDIKEPRTVTFKLR